jgi:hypothetical protein
LPAIVDVEVLNINSHHLERKNSQRSASNSLRSKSVRGIGRPGNLDDNKRIFWRNPDDTKLYTHRFVRKLKAAHKKVI